MEDGVWIVELISQYLSSARSLSQRLREAFNQEDLLSGHRSKMIPRTGIAANPLGWREVQGGAPGRAEGTRRRGNDSR